MGKQVICAWVLCAMVSPWTQAATLQNTEYAIWGFDKSELTIPEGCVVTDAVLTVQAVKSSSTQLKVHLLDDPQGGLEMGSDEGQPDFFGQAGVVLNGSYENGDMVYRLADNNDSSSTVWNVFEQPFTVSLTDSSTVNFTSSMLELLDFAGTGMGFGFGLDVLGSEKLSYYNIVLDIVVSPYSGSQSAQTYQYKLFDLPDLEDPVVENLLVNGGFESGDSSWINYSSWNIVKDSANAYTGNYCMRFESGPSYSGDYAAYQYIGVEPDTAYSFSAMVKNDSYKQMRLLVVYQDASRRYIGHTYGTPMVSSSYHLTDMQFTTPSGCDNVIIAVCVFGVQQNDGTKAYADECVLEAVQ